jgi:hypothetical protein
MTSFHAVKLWQKETIHYLYHMNIIIQTPPNGEEGSTLSRPFCCRGANYVAIKINFCVGLSFNSSNFRG